MAVDPGLLDLVRQASGKYGVPADLLAATIQSESNFNPNAVSSAGAQGIAQFMPGTWSGSWNPYNSRPATDPAAAIPASALYLSRLNQQLPGGWDEALAGYNAGPNAVLRAGGIPNIAETQAYIRRINERRSRFPGVAQGDASGSSGSLSTISGAPERKPAQGVTANASQSGGVGASGRQAFLQGLVDQTADIAGIRPLALPVVDTPNPPTLTPPRGSAPSVNPDEHDLPPNTTGYPFAHPGKVIGTPHSGTHTLGNWESDNAIDIAAHPGTPIYAIADGTIGDRFGALGSGNPRFAGLRLHLNFADGSNEAYYAHLSRFADGIQPGAQVRKGQLIGYSGEANGVGHLHLGLRNGNVEAYD